MLYKSVKEAVEKFKNGLKNPSNEKLLKKDGKINEKAIEDAVKLAFPDITPRTMDRNRNDNKVRADLKDKKFDELYKFLLDYAIPDKDCFHQLIEDWFNKKDSEKTEDAFDEFHQNACKTVIAFLEAAGYDDESCAYGKAQKVVNMTFKHLYCMEGALCLFSSKSFEFCHMALDSFTLEWLKRTKDKNQSDIIKGKVDNWSTIQNPYDEEKKEFSEFYKKKNKDKKESEFYSYHSLVQYVRKVISETEYKGLPPLQAEFYIWPEIQLHMAAEALYFFDMDETKAEDLIGKRVYQKDKIKQAKKIFKTGKSLTEKLELVKETIDRLYQQCGSDNTSDTNTAALH